MLLQIREGLLYHSDVSHVYIEILFVVALNTAMTVTENVLLCEQVRNLIEGASTRERVHLFMRVHFRSRDKMAVTCNRSAVAESPMLHANFIRGD